MNKYVRSKRSMCLSGVCRNVLLVLLVVIVKQAQRHCSYVRQIFGVPQLPHW